MNPRPTDLLFKFTDKLHSVASFETYSVFRIYESRQRTFGSGLRHRIPFGGISSSSPLSSPSLRPSQLFLKPKLRKKNFTKRRECKKINNSWGEGGVLFYWDCFYILCAERITWNMTIAIKIVVSQLSLKLKWNRERGKIIIYSIGKISKDFQDGGVKWNVSCLFRKC